MSPNQALVVVAEQRRGRAGSVRRRRAYRACPVLAVQLRRRRDRRPRKPQPSCGWAGTCGQFPHQRRGALALDIEAHGEGYRPAGRPSIPDISSEAAHRGRMPGVRIQSAARCTARRFTLKRVSGVNRRTSRAQTRNNWVGWIRCGFPYCPDNCRSSAGLSGCRSAAHRDRIDADWPQHDELRTHSAISDGRQVMFQIRDSGLVSEPNTAATRRACALIVRLPSATEAGRRRRCRGRPYWAAVLSKCCASRHAVDLLAKMTAARVRAARRSQASTSAADDAVVGGDLVVEGA